MGKGRNSTVISIRVSDSVYTMLQERAKVKGYTSVGQYIQSQVSKACSHSVNKVVNTIESPPIYNPAIHKPGDKVLIPKGKVLVPAIVPDVDADGRAIPW